MATAPAGACDTRIQVELAAGAVVILQPGTRSNPKTHDDCILQHCSSDLQSIHVAEQSPFSIILCADAVVMVATTATAPGRSVDTWSRKMVPLR